MGNSKAPPELGKVARCASTLRLRRRYFMSEQRTSPSFLIVVGLMVVAGLAYLIWPFLAPNPVGESEMVVRTLSTSIAGELGPFRRAVRQIEREARRSAETAATARERIDDLATDVNDRIVDLADQATFAVEAIQGISLSTQENRLSRVRRLSLEGRARVGQIVAEAKAALAERESGEPHE